MKDKKTKGPTNKMLFWVYYFGMSSIRISLYVQPVIHPLQCAFQRNCSYDFRLPSSCLRNNTRCVPCLPFSVTEMSMDVILLVDYVNISFRPWKNTTFYHDLVHISFSLALPAHSGPWPLIQFRNHFSQTVGLLGRVMISLQGRYVHQTSMPRVGFEAKIPASERAKTVHTLDRAATVTGT
jgi:hypothetical protein